jgi:hypothetical protein
VEPEVEARAARCAAFGAAAAVFGLAAVLVGALQSGRSFFTRGGTLVGAAALAAAVACYAYASSLRTRSRRRPMLRRPARVLDRRSRTELVERVGATTYFFQLRFADGSQGEFRMPGRGTMFEPPTVGATGLAYTRGSDLVEFKRL